MSDNLRIGIPSKGRLAEMASQLLIEAGLKFRRQERSLFARVRDMPIEVTFLRTDDIPVLCAEGAIDMGITGGDLIDETGVELTNRLSLGMGNWRLAICVPEDSRHSQAGRLGGQPHRDEFSARHAEVSRSAQDHGPHRAVDRLGGSDDHAGRCRRDRRPRGNGQHAGRQSADGARRAGPLRSGARAESGDEARRNWPTASSAGWKASSSPAAIRCWNTTCRRRSWREAEKITPGFESPTINKLEEAGWFAVRAMVKRSEVIEIMERLDALGATAILETTITNCRL